MRVVAESLLQAGMESSRSQTQDKIFDEALHWLELAAESGDLEAMKRLVRCRDGSLHYKLSNDQEHKKWLSTLAGMQSLPEMFALGKIQMNEGNWVAGQEWWISAARQRYIPAVAALVEWIGREGFTQLAQQWMEYLQNPDADFPEGARLIPVEAAPLNQEVNDDDDSLDFADSQITQGPLLRLIRTPRDAEIVAAEWLRYFGFADAVVTGNGADGGIDVESSLAVAQVKFKGVQTGRPELQQLFGVASHFGKHAFFFSLSEYSQVAINFADEAGISLFKFDYQGQPVAVNALAENFLPSESLLWDQDEFEDEGEEIEDDHEAEES